MTETASIYKGDTAGPWKIGHLLDDGTLADLDSNYTCTIKLAGAGIESAVTTKNGANDRFLAALTPAQTSGLAAGQYVLAIELANATLTPPLRVETHIILTVGEEIVGSDYVPVAETAIEALTRMIAEAIAKRHEVALGEVVIEVMRGGKRMKMTATSIAELNDYILEMRRELATLTAVEAGGPRRRPIGLAWKN